MTFIASVIAKKGVAIIADSLVTTSKAIISAEDFFQYLSEKSSASHETNVVLDPEEVIQLFKQTTSHTKDFEEKLFKYDNYTAITTAGAAIINKKKIEQIVNELLGLNNANPDYEAKKLEEKIIDFCEYVEKEVRNHIVDNQIFKGTSFIITNYEPTLKKTTVFRVDAKNATISDAKNADVKLVEYRLVPDYERVVCDGQNRISDRILYGELETFMEIVPHIVEKIFTDFGIKSSAYDYADKLIKEDILKNSKYIDDMKMYQLTDLSLQQAIDLAYLLMRIEIDIQKYTKNIPTVGGVIKVAVIDDEGFRFIAGNKIQTKELFQ